MLGVAVPGWARANAARLDLCTWSSHGGSCVEVWGCGMLNAVMLGDLSSLLGLWCIIGCEVAGSLCVIPRMVGNRQSAAAMEERELVSVGLRCFMMISLSGITRHRLDYTGYVLFCFLLRSGRYNSSCRQQTAPSSESHEILKIYALYVSYQILVRWARLHVPVCFSRV